MNLEIFTSLVAALASFLLGMAAYFPVVLIRKARRRPDGGTKPYAERLAELSASLTGASREVDSVLRELAQAARDREDTVRRLEEDLASLENREKDLKNSIEILEKIPIPVAEHFAELLESRERRSARRDYVLFGSGVVLTTLVDIIIRIWVG